VAEPCRYAVRLVLVSRATRSAFALRARRPAGESRQRHCLIRNVMSGSSPPGGLSALPARRGVPPRTGGWRDVPTAPGVTVPQRSTVQSVRSQSAPRYPPDRGGFLRRRGALDEPASSSLGGVGQARPARFPSRQLSALHTPWPGARRRPPSRFGRSCRGADGAARTGVAARTPPGTSSVPPGSWSAR
jgi:hypothetical protein